MPPHPPMWVRTSRCRCLVWLGRPSLTPVLEDYELFDFEVKLSEGAEPVAKGATNCRSVFVHLPGPPLIDRIASKASGLSLPAAQAAPAQRPSGRVIEGKPDDYKVGRPWDLMEEVPHQGPLIFGYTFRYVTLEGPALIGLIGPGDMNDVTFGVTNDDIESILWDFGDLNRSRLGPIAVQNCNFEHCRFESIGITGHPAVLNKIRQFKKAPAGDQHNIDPS